MTLPMHTSKRCSIKSTEDQGKNSTLTRLNVVSSETSTNFAFAVGLYLLIKKRHFPQVFVPHILIFKKLHLLLLSKMEVQAENGAKNH